MFPLLLGLNNSYFNNTEYSKNSYNVKEAAQLLGISEYTMRKKIRDGEIKADGKPNRSGYIINKQEIEKYSAKTQKSGIVIGKKMSKNDFNILYNITNWEDEEYLTDIKKGIKNDIKLKKLQLKRLQMDKDDSDEYKKQELDIQIEMKALKNQLKWLKVKIKSLQKQ